MCAARRRPEAVTDEEILALQLANNAAVAPMQHKLCGYCAAYPRALGAGDQTYWSSHPLPDKYWRCERCRTPNANKRTDASDPAPGWRVYAEREHSQPVPRPHVFRTSHDNDPPRDLSELGFPPPPWPDVDESELQVLTDDEARALLLAASRGETEDPPAPPVPEDPSEADDDPSAAPEEGKVEYIFNVRARAAAARRRRRLAADGKSWDNHGWSGQ
jgi:hypothetical protein